MNHLGPMRGSHEVSDGRLLGPGDQHPHTPLMSVDSLDTCVARVGCPFKCPCVGSHQGAVHEVTGSRDV